MIRRLSGFATLNTNLRNPAYTAVLNQNIPNPRYGAYLFFINLNNKNVITENTDKINVSLMFSFVKTLSKIEILFVQESNINAVPSNKYIINKQIAIKPNITSNTFLITLFCQPFQVNKSFKTIYHAFHSCVIRFKRTRNCF